MILRQNDRVNNSSAHRRMFEKLPGGANGYVMQNIPSLAARADNGTKMDFKDEIEDEFDDLNCEVKSEVDGDRISLKSPIGSKDAFDVVDEIIGEEDNPVNGNKSEEDENIKSEEEGGNGEFITDEVDDTSNGDFTPLELCEEAEMLDDQAQSMEEDEEMENGDDIDPLMAENGASEEDDQRPEPVQNNGKRKAEEEEDGITVRKSSRLRSKAESREEKAAAAAASAAQEKPKEKQKMLQKPSERPVQIGIDEEDTGNSDLEVPEDAPDAGKENVEQLGDPSQKPGHNATRMIDLDFLSPFLHGWIRECQYREMKVGPAIVENVYYVPPNDGVDHGAKNREAKRKRRNKHDQERYFEDFPSQKLSVNNFSYVKRELGLNNEAFEKITTLKGGPDTRTAEATRRSSRKEKSYREVPEHQGLLETDHSESESSDGGGVEEVTEFDIGLPLTLQIQSRSTPFREEHKKRRKYPDRRRCVTPPLAADIPWTQLDDDPLGVWTELRAEYIAQGDPSPALPPPLAALRLTHLVTVETIDTKLEKIRAGLCDPLTRIVAENKDLRGSEHLASHDLAIRKYKHMSSAPYRPPMRPGFMGNKKPPPHMMNRSGLSSQARPGQNSVSRPGGQNSGQSQGFVKVRLPMASSNGKRPVVELVMLTNGKYQPIKFTNNRQVTEAIPKRLFDQANLLRKTLYQRSVQVPKIGTKQVFLAINPTPGGVKPYSSVSSGAQTKTGNNQQQTASPKPAAPGKPPSDQVSILVRPSTGGNAVLLNVPRNVATKVKVGTTLSFSASTDQKYTVIDNKLHPPVGKHKPTGSKPSVPTKPQQQASSGKQQLPSLPSGVSIRPVAPGAGSRPSPVTSGRPAPSSLNSGGAAKVQRQNVSIKPKPSAPQQTPRAHKPDLTNFTPCSPFCPGALGIPELECIQCASLFHPKCVGIPQWQVASIAAKFKCKVCSF